MTVRFRNTIIVAAGIATGLYVLSIIHYSWDNWFWNFGCFIVAITAVDLSKGKRIIW